MLVLVESVFRELYEIVKYPLFSLDVLNRFRSLALGFFHYSGARAVPTYYVSYRLLYALRLFSFVIGSPIYLISGKAFLRVHVVLPMVIIIIIISMWGFDVEFSIDSMIYLAFGDHFNSKSLDSLSLSDLHGLRSETDPPFYN